MEKKIIISLISLFAVNSIFGQFQQEPAWEGNVNRPYYATVGDLNSDGVNDLLVNQNINQANSNLLLFLGCEDGFFEKTPGRIIKIPNVYGISLYDFDQDGKNDIGAVSYQEYFRVLLAKDDFTPDQILNFYSGHHRGIIANIIKADHDKFLYDVYIGPSFRRFRFSEKPVQAGPHTLTQKIAPNKYLYAQPAYIFGTRPTNIRNARLLNDSDVRQSAIPVDIDGDKKTDIVATDRKYQFIRIYYGPFGGNIQPEKIHSFVEISTPERLSGEQCLAVGDLNSDGFTDIVACSKDKTFIYLQPDPEGFTNTTKPTSIINSGGRCYVKDLNNDGLKDLVIHIGGRSGSKVATFLQKKNGISADLSGADQVLKIPPAYNIIFGDVDNNKKLDLIVLDFKKSKVKIYKNR